MKSQVINPSPKFEVVSPAHTHHTTHTRSLARLIAHSFAHLNIQITLLFIMRWIFVKITHQQAKWTNERTKKKYSPIRVCVREREFLVRCVNARMSAVAAAADVEQDVVENWMECVEYVRLLNIWWALPTTAKTIDFEILTAYNFKFVLCVRLHTPL